MQTLANILFLQADEYGNNTQYIKKLDLLGLTVVENFPMVEYCEFFKMTFAKILDFLLRLKIRSKAPTSY